MLTGSLSQRFLLFSHQSLPSVSWTGGFPWGGAYYRTNQAIFHNGNVACRSCSYARQPRSIKSTIPVGEQSRCCAFLPKVAFLPSDKNFLSHLILQAINISLWLYFPCTGWFFDTAFLDPANRGNAMIDHK